jgi:hypothetical protein
LLYSPSQVSCENVTLGVIRGIIPSHSNLKPNRAVALQNDCYSLHKILLTKVELLSLMKFKAIPDST